MKKILLITGLIFAALTGKAQVKVIITPGEITVCYGGDVELKAELEEQNPDDIVSYKWDTGNEADTLHILTLQNLTQAITVTCTVTVKNGGTIEGSGSANIDVYPQFYKGSIITDTQTFCSGTQSIQIDEDENLPANGKDIIYKWKYNGNDINDSNYPAFNKIMELPPGEYIFTREVSDGCGNSAASDGIYTVTVLEPPTLILESGDANPKICIGGEISGLIYKYGGSATSVSVTWIEQEPIGINYIVQDSKVTFSGTPTKSGNFPFRIETISDISCNEATVTGSFIVNSLPVFAAYADPSEVCDGSPTTLKTITEESDLEFLWFLPNGTTYTGSECPVFADINAKSYKVIATNGNACHKDTTISLNVLESPKLNKIVAMPEDNPILLLYPNPEDDFYYQWYKNEVAIPGANGQFYYPGNSGIDQDAKYQVYISRSNPKLCGRLSEEYPEKRLVETQNTTSEKGFAISPNPANMSNINLIFNNEEIEIKKEAGISLINYAGTTLYTTKINSLSELRINTPLAKGLYFVTVTTDLGKIYTEKLIVK